MSESEKNIFLVPPSAQGSRAASDTINFPIASTFNLLRLITGDKHHIPLSIPHTITFKTHDAPAWYFTSKQKQHSVLRKNNSNVTMDGIFEHLKKSLITQSKHIFQMNHEQARNTMKERKTEEANKKKELTEKKKIASKKGSSIIIEEEEIDPTVIAVMTSQREIATDRIKAEVDFMTKANLKKLLFDKRQKRISNGFLQQFVPPRGDYNTHIKVTWTPGMSLVEHKRNKYRINDESVNIFKRLSILHNEDSWQVAETLDTNILTQIDRITQGISQQMFRITENVHTVRKMVMTFKLDSVGKLWFLFFDSFRTSTENYPKPAKWINYSLYNVSNEIKQKKNDDENNEDEDNDDENQQRNISISKTNPISRHTIATNSKQRPSTSPSKLRTSNRNSSLGNPAALAECPSCTVIFDRQSGIDISYGAIIQFYDIKKNQEINADQQIKQEIPFLEDIDASLSDEEFGGFGTIKYNDFDDKSDISETNVEIPEVIQRLEPSLGSMRYTKLRENKIWTSKKVKVCSECATDYLNEIVFNSNKNMKEEIPKSRSISTTRLEQLSKPLSSRLSNKALEKRNGPNSLNTQENELALPLKKKSNENQPWAQTNLALIKQLLNIGEELSIPIYMQSENGNIPLSQRSSKSARPKTTPSNSKGIPKNKPLSRSSIYLGSNTTPTKSIQSKQGQKPIEKSTKSKGLVPPIQSSEGRLITEEFIFDSRGNSPIEAINENKKSKDQSNKTQKIADKPRTKSRNSINQNSLPLSRASIYSQNSDHSIVLQTLNDARQQILQSLQDDMEDITSDDPIQNEDSKEIDTSIVPGETIDLSLKDTLVLQSSQLSASFDEGIFDEKDFSMEF